MRRLAHLSDLHFGTDEPALVAGVLECLHAMDPHVVVVTGDLTQRAREHEFLAARRFLDHIKRPLVVVPGNHDIPLYNVAARFLWPLAGYRRHITEDLQPTFEDRELAIAGINTARSNTWKDGRVSPADIQWLGEYFGSPGGAGFKVLAAHHPFVPPVQGPSATLVGRAGEAMRMLASRGCHLVLAGHLHQAYAGEARPHHVEMERSVLVVQAGTATSHRRRGEANAFNLLTVDGSRLLLDVRTWDGERFASAGVTEYEYVAGDWSEGRRAAS